MRFCCKGLFKIKVKFKFKKIFNTDVIFFQILSWHESRATLYEQREASILSYLTNDFINLCTWQMSKIVDSLPSIHFALLRLSNQASLIRQSVSDSAPRTQATGHGRVKTL